MWKKIFQTKPDIALFILRAVLGLVFFPHGAQKALGWFGGYGFSSTVTSFRDQLHIPVVLAVLVIITEFGGSLALLLGFLTRAVALGIAVIMAVAISIHANSGFFMNWSGAQKGEGFEYHLLVIAIAVALMIKGAGSFSIDRIISKES